jgi:hypothetical protein
MQSLQATSHGPATWTDNPNRRSLGALFISLLPVVTQRLDLLSMAGGLLRTGKDDHDWKACRIDSRGDVAGGLLRFRISPTDHAADHNDNYHHLPVRDTASERWDVSVRYRYSELKLWCIDKAADRGQDVTDGSGLFEKKTGSMPSLQDRREGGSTFNGPWNKAA